LDYSILLKGLLHAMPKGFALPLDKQYTITSEFLPQ